MQHPDNDADNGGHVKKMIISASTAGAAGVAASVFGLFGAGIASANTSAPPDVVGMTYGDCLVTSATNAPFMEVSDGAFQHVDSVVLLSLNCDRGVATATTPGASLGSPEGRAFQAKAEKAAEAAKQKQ